MKYLIAILLTDIFFSFIGFAQSKDDSLILLNELNFTSSFERKVYLDFVTNKESDFFKLFYAQNSNNSEKDYLKTLNRYNEFMKYLKSNKVTKKKEAKKIKTIYQYVHKTYLRKYKLEVEFDELTSMGTYNCVTATAFYGTILNQLNIPFIIKETPIHVYLITYPETNNIKIETTDPLTGYISYDNRFKKSYIEYLHNQKLISSKEYDSLSIDELFNKHYYPDTDIDLKQLAGVQYLNLAIFANDHQNYEKAYQSIEKAYILYPSEKIKYTLFQLLVEYASRNEFSTLIDVHILIKIARHTNQEKINELIENYFLTITRNYLIEKGNKLYYDSVYNYMISKLSDTTIKNEISYIYYYESGRYFQNKGLFDQSNENLFKAFKLKQSNSNAQAAFIYSLATKMNNYETSDNIEMVEEYYKEFQSLKKNNLFTILLLELYLRYAYEQFTISSFIEGNKYLNKFESIYDNTENVKIDDELISETYITASVYYFKQGNHSKSKKLILKALEYAPYNARLRTILETF